MRTLHDVDDWADLNAMSLPDLYATQIDREHLDALIRLAREEDLGTAGDVTSQSIIDPQRRAAASLRTRRAGIAAGLPTMESVLRIFGGDVTIIDHVDDGTACAAGSELAQIRGNLRSILAAERTLLNLVGRLSGIATITRSYVEAIGGTGATICETRKTTPGWRDLEKYAARCGGATLHRAGLYDALLYKDNHLAHLGVNEFADALRNAIDDAQAAGPLRFVEVEVDTLEQFEAVLPIAHTHMHIVLLDNMTPDQLRDAVALRDDRAPELRLEASGGITLENVRAVAETGVDRISVGAITHAAAALDIGLDVVDA